MAALAGASLGSIPACAGEPWAAVITRAGLGVYPRVCGGTSAGVKRGRGMPGLSPRVRGNLGQQSHRNPPAGSIPACAGEPLERDIGQYQAGVYPRVCGGTPVQANIGGVAAGLSPRVRGNRVE